MSDTNKFLYNLFLEDGLYRSKDGIIWEKWKEAEDLNQSPNQKVIK